MMERHLPRRRAYIWHDLNWKTYIEDWLSMFNCLGHVSSSSMEFCVFHIVNFFHNFFSGEGFKSNNIMDILHKLENGHSSGVVRVRNAKLFIEGVYGRSCKFFIWSQKDDVF